MENKRITIFDNYVHQFVIEHFDFRNLLSERMSRDIIRNLIYQQLKEEILNDSTNR